MILRQEIDGEDVIFVDRKQFGTPIIQGQTNLRSVTINGSPTSLGSNQTGSLSAFGLPNVFSYQR